MSENGFPVTSSERLRDGACLALKRQPASANSVIAAEIQTRLDVEGNELPEHIRDFVESHRHRPRGLLHDQRLRLPVPSSRADSPARQVRQIISLRLSLSSSSWSAACCCSHWSFG